MSDTTKRTQRATEFVTSPLLTDLLPGYHGYLIGEQRRPQGIKSYLNHLRRVITWLGDDATLADLTQRAVLRYKGPKRRHTIPQHDGEDARHTARLCVLGK
jgi:hypothetical protein